MKPIATLGGNAATETLFLLELFPIGADLANSDLFFTNEKSWACV
jgi:hypothetical protein